MRLRPEVREDGRLAINGIELPISQGFQTGCAVLFAVPFGLLFLLMLLFSALVAVDGDVYGALQPLIFGLVIGGIGLVPLIWLFWARRRAAERATFNAEPWRKREAWRTNTVRESYAERIRGVFFAVLWNAIAWPAAISVTIAQAPASPLVWGVWLFPVIGLGVLGRALLPAWQRWRYGRRVFEMDTYPGRVGSMLRGTVRSDLKDRTLLGELFTVRLGCYCRYIAHTRDRDGDTRRRVRHERIWSETQRVQGREMSSDFGLEVPIEIDIPPGLQAAPVRKQESRIVWRLDVEAERPGVDFHARFEIPVMEAMQPAETSAADEPALPEGLPAEPIPARTGDAHREAASTEERAAPAVLESEYGEKPWLHRKAWTTPRIAPDRNRDREAHWLVIFGFAWLAITAGATYMYANGVGEGGSPALFIIFALMGMLVFGIGAYRMIRNRKYRDVMLELDEVPGALGGTIAGRLETDIPVRSRPVEGFSVKFTCYRRRVRRAPDGDRSVSHTPIWRSETTMQPRPYGEGNHLAVPFFFRIPPNLPESTPVDRPNRIAWKIEVDAEMPGVDFAAEIEVPVFVVEGRSRVEGAEAEQVHGKEAAYQESEPSGPVSPLMEADEPEAPDNPYAEAEMRREMTEPVSSGIEMHQTTAGGTGFYFGPARHKGAALMLTAFFALMAGLLLAGMLFGNFEILGALVLFFFAAVTGYGAWHYWTHASRMTVEHGIITVKRGPFALGREKRLRCAALAKVEVATRTDGKYDLRLVRGDMSDAQKEAARQEKLEHAEWVEGWLRSAGLVGRRSQSDGSLEENLEQHGMLDDKIKVAEALSDRREAEWIAARIEELAGMQE